MVATWPSCAGSVCDSTEAVSRMEMNVAPPLPEIPSSPSKVFRPLAEPERENLAFLLLAPAFTPLLARMTLVTTPKPSAILPSLAIPTFSACAYSQSYWSWIRARSLRRCSP
ncbi:hypothetical protein D3C81_1774470 [compost metagenome]